MQHQVLEASFPEPTWEGDIRGIETLDLSGQDPELQAQQMV